MQLTITFVTAGLAALSAVQGSQLTRVKRNNGGSKDIDTTILQYALTLEHLENKFYSDALARFSEADFEAAGYPAVVRQRIFETGAEEAVHVKTLEAVIGKGATKPCKYSFPYNTVDEFLGLSAVLEGVGVSAYLGAAPLITGKDYLAAAGAILTVEARHQAVISEFIGQDGHPGPFDTALDFSQVYSLASQFIVKCPSSNPKLPVTAFPALTYTGNPNVGGTLTFSFKPQKGKKYYYAHFINGLGVTTIKLNNKHQARVPKGLQGRTYVVITNCDILGDLGTVAGPAIIESGFYSTGPASTPPQ